MLSTERLHAEDTTVPVLAKGKTSTGRIWVHVRDDKPFCRPAPSGADFTAPRWAGGQLRRIWPAMAESKLRTGV